MNVKRKVNRKTCDEIKETKWERVNKAWEIHRLTYSKLRVVHSQYCVVSLSAVGLQQPTCPRRWEYRQGWYYWRGCGCRSSGKRHGTYRKNMGGKYLSFSLSIITKTFSGEWFPCYPLICTFNTSFSFHLNMCDGCTQCSIFLIACIKMSVTNYRTFPFLHWWL